MSEDKASKDRMTELLEELVKWIKATSIPKVRDIVEELVRTPGERIVYKFSDGKTARKELSEMSGIDEGDISRDWKKWARGGILEQIPSQGGSRGKSLFSLEDFGIEVPPVPQAIKEKKDCKKENETDPQTVSKVKI
jgi:hypothetical protein